MKKKNKNVRYTQYNTAMTNIYKDIVRAKSTYQNNKIYWTCWIWELHYLLSSQFGRSSIINNHYNAIELATNGRNEYDNTGMKKVLRHLSQIKRLIVLIINPKLDLRCVADLDDWIKYIAHNSHYFYWWHIKCIQRFIHEILCVYIRLLLGFLLLSIVRRECERLFHITSSFRCT